MSEEELSAGGDGPPAGVAGDGCGRDGSWVSLGVAEGGAWEVAAEGLLSEGLSGWREEEGAGCLEGSGATCWSWESE